MTAEELLRESYDMLTRVGHRRSCGTAGQTECECGMTQLRHAISAHLAARAALMDEPVLDVVGTLESRICHLTAENERLREARYRAIAGEAK